MSLTWIQQSKFTSEESSETELAKLLKADLVELVAILQYKLLASVKRETSFGSQIKKLKAQVEDLEQFRPKPPETPPEHFCGWKVQQTAGGYYRLLKRVDGAVKTVYVGKKWSSALAEEKLTGLVECKKT